MDIPHKPSNTARIVKTGFFSSVFTYGAFLLLDLARPGFVSRVFSVHVFLLAAIVFGLWWGIILKEEKDRVIWQYTLMILLGVILAILSWNAGVAFGPFRLFITALSLVIPLVALRIIRTT